MENSQANVIAAVSSALQRTAIGVGADVIALLDAGGSELEVMCFRAGSRQRATEPLSFPPNGLLAEAVGRAAATGRSVIAAGGSRLATLLRDMISEHSQSFLLFPWQRNQRVITGVIGFTESNPPFSQVPEAVLEDLDLLGWATWSAKEIGRLRGELRIVNERLAGRKLVERAKSVLQAERSMSEEQAYEYLRSLSRKRRITLAKLSSEILSERAEGNPKELLAAGSCESIVGR
jgi:hypothetical protein